VSKEAMQETQTSYVETQSKAFGPDKNVFSFTNCDRISSFLMTLFAIFFIAIARTAQSEEPSTTVARKTSLSTVGNRNSADRRQFSILTSLVVILAIILLSHFSE